MGGLSQLGIRIANTLLFVVCAYLSAGVVNEVGGELLAPAAASASPVARTAPAARRTWNERQPILDRNLFGAQIAGDAVVEAEPQEDLEETKLPLRLLGTAASDDPDLSTAAIEDKSSKTHEVVRVGDRLEKHQRVQVVRIEPKRVILQNGARREELLLDENLPPSSTPKRVARRGRSTPRRSSPPSRRLSNRLKELRESQAQSGSDSPRNAANLFSEARILPKYEEGEMVGIQLSAIKSGSMYEKFGFKDGDVITELNGIAIDNPSASAKLLSELSQADEFEFMVNGESRVIPADQVSAILDSL